MGIMIPGGGQREKKTDAAEYNRCSNEGRNMCIAFSQSSLPQV